MRDSKAIRYRSKDGRELFVSDGDSSGKEWAIYYTTRIGEVKRAAVLMPEPTAEQMLAQFLLNAIAREYGFEAVS